MKVMQINAVYGVGSTGIIVEDIHNLSLQSGIDSYVSYSTSPKSSSDIKNSYIIGDRLGKKIHAVLCRVGGKQAYFSRNATRKLISYIEEVKPDVVHLHNLHSNYIHLNMLLKYLASKNIHTVITLHDCWFYTGGCFHYTFDNCLKWLDSCGNCPKKRQDTPAYLYDSSAKILADRKKYLSGISYLTVVGVSEWISKEAEKTFLRDKNIVTIHNGIDTDFFVDTPSSLRKKYGIEDKFVILCPANKWLKQINKETLEYVSSNLPSDSILVLLGCNAGQKISLPDNVLPLDYVKDRDELRKVYSMADVFANCTREDSLSLINVEVQSCGTPVVTYCNTGAKETVDEKCGFSVESGNYQDFLNRILYIKKQGKSAFSDNCHKWAVSKFCRDNNYRKYLELYYDLLQKGKKE